MAIKRKAVKKKGTVTKYRKNPGLMGVSPKRLNKYGYPHRPVVYSSDGMSVKTPVGKKTVKYNPSTRRRIVKRNPAMSEIVSIAVNGSLVGAGIIINGKIVPMITSKMGVQSPAILNVVKLVTAVGLGWIVNKYLPKQYGEYLALGLVGETVQSMVRTALGMSVPVSGENMMLGQDMMLGSNNSMSLLGTDLLDGFEHSDGMENSYI